MDLCKYKNALGVPGKGIHSYRLFGVAIADVIMTIIGALLISFFFKTKFVYTLVVVVFVLGIVLHRLFCVRTTLDKILFPQS
jgi:Na+/melibiose symporter-like transporter